MKGRWKTGKKRRREEKKGDETNVKHQNIPDLPKLLCSNNDDDNDSSNRCRLLSVHTIPATGSIPLHPSGVPVRSYYYLSIMRERRRASHIVNDRTRLPDIKT